MKEESPTIQSFDDNVRRDPRVAPANVEQPAPTPEKNQLSQLRLSSMFGGSKRKEFLKAEQELAIQRQIQLQELQERATKERLEKEAAEREQERQRELVEREQQRERDERVRQVEPGMQMHPADDMEYQPPAAEVQQDNEENGWQRKTKGGKGYGKDRRPYSKGKGGGKRASDPNNQEDKKQKLAQCVRTQLDQVRERAGCKRSPEYWKDYVERRVAEFMELWPGSHWHVRNAFMGIYCMEDNKVVRQVDEDSVVNSLELMMRYLEGKRNPSPKERSDLDAEASGLVVIEGTKMILCDLDAGMAMLETQRFKTAWSTASDEKRNLLRGALTLVSDNLEVSAMRNLDRDFGPGAFETKIDLTAIFDAIEAEGGEVREIPQRAVAHAPASFPVDLDVDYEYEPAPKSTSNSRLRLAAVLRGERDPGARTSALGRVTWGGSVSRDFERAAPYHRHDRIQTSMGYRDDTNRLMTFSNRFRHRFER